MGTRRKAKTGGSAYAAPRNLSKSSLHGVIFGCNNNTMQECLSKQLFGLPSSHFLYVKNIEPGLPLFLFNYNDKKMHGIYEAASRGEMNIDPCAWTNNGKEKTGFPAQVCIRLQTQCEPITENQFKKVIDNNYYKHKKFWFELDKAQTEGLISLFLGSDDMSPTPGIGNVKSFKTSTPIKCNLPAKFGSAPFEAAETGRTNEPPQFAGERLEYEKMRWQMIEKQPADPNFSSAFPNSGIDYHIPNMPGDINEGSMYPEETSVSVEKTIETTTDLCNDNAELICIVKELKERAVTLEKRQMESEQEVQRLQNVVRCSGVQIQQLKSCVKELESKIMRSMESQNAIYLIGGFNGESWLSTLNSFSPSMDVIMPLKPMDSARAYASAAVLNGNVYVFGGGDGNTWLNTVECYSQRNNNWTSCPPLNRSKGSLAGATLNGKIFALGGGNGADSFSDVEIFDPALEKWIYNQPMLQKRFALAAGELCGVLYATGGFDGQGYLQTAERLDPRVGYWTKVPNMKTRRGSHSIAVLNEKLYAMGGFDGNKMVSSVEIFDPRNDSWVEVGSLNHVRGYAASTVLGGSIFILGGVDDDCDFVQTVECYIEGTGWAKCNNNAVGKRSAFQAVVL